MSRHCLVFGSDETLCYSLSPKFIENLRNTEVVFYDTLFKSEKLNLNLYFKKYMSKIKDLYLFEIKNIIPFIIRPVTVRNSQLRSVTVRNSQERSGTIKNDQERSGTILALK